MEDISDIAVIVTSSACSEGRERFARFLKSSVHTLDAYATMWRDDVSNDLLWLLPRLPSDHPLRVRLCSDGDPHVRAEAVRGLSSEHSARVKACEDTHRHVREAAVSGLPPEHAERVRLCEDPRWNVRAEAVRGLPAEHPARVAACRDRAWEVREVAVSKSTH